MKRVGDRQIRIANRRHACTLLATARADDPVLVAELPLVSKQHPWPIRRTVGRGWTAPDGRVWLLTGAGEIVRLDWHKARRNPHAAAAWKVFGWGKEPRVVAAGESVLVKAVGESLTPSDLAFLHDESVKRVVLMGAGISTAASS